VLASACAFAKIDFAARGRVAQLGERLVRNEEAGGSNPLSSTKYIFENPVLLVSRTVTNPSQIVESIAKVLRINATILMLILCVLD
jgi:hypothetical protein